MIDIHSHILPGIDDGARDVAEGLEMARELVNWGVKKVIATPHFLENGPRLTPEETREKVGEFQERIVSEKINLEVLPGAEVFITADLGKKVDNGEVPTLNGTRYILLELPLEKVPAFAEHVFFDLKVMGYIPVLAHPERNIGIQKNPNFLYRWTKYGVRVQINSGSIMGVFGRKARKTAKIILRNRLGHFLATDAHSRGKKGNCLVRGMEAVRRTAGKSLTREFKENSRMLVENRELLPSEPTPFVPSGKLTGLILGKKF